MVNITLFEYELRQSLLPIVGLSSSPSVDFVDCRIDWEVGHPTQTELDTAKSLYAAHDPNKLMPVDQAAKDAVANYANLPTWAKTGTASEAETYITNQIFSGQTQAQVDAWIDANITGTTIAALRTQLIAALKITAGAVITMRGLFILTSKLLIYIRDLVIRFRQ